MVQTGRILLIKFNKFKNSGVGLDAGTINKYFNLNGANLYNYSGIPECFTFFVMLDWSFFKLNRKFFATLNSILISRKLTLIFRFYHSPTSFKYMNPIFLNHYNIGIYYLNSHWPISGIFWILLFFLELSKNDLTVCFHSGCLTPLLQCWIHK